MVLTSEMLSARVRLFGCVATTSSTAESGPAFRVAVSAAAGCLAPVRFCAVSVLDVAPRDVDEPVAPDVSGGVAAATAPGDESFVAGTVLVGVGFPSPHATAKSKLDERKTARRVVGIVGAQLQWTHPRPLNPRKEF